MQYLFHTDFLIDLIRANTGIGKKILDRCGEGTLKGWVLAPAIPIIDAQVGQPGKEPHAREQIREVLQSLSLLTPTAQDLNQSLAAAEADLLVSLAARTAAACGLDGVVALDPKAFAGTAMDALTPEELLAKLDGPAKPVERVPLLDIPASYHEISGAVENKIAGVIRSGHFILGAEVADLEKNIAEYCHCDYGVGVSSGTDALLVSLMAAGIGAGDEVLTTPYTFFATVGCITRVGARPVFVDIDATTYNMDPGQIEQRITAKTRAAIPVHLYGQCADMDPILEIARQHKLVVIEDAAQAIGSEYHSRRAGSLGDFGCFSFFPTKNLGGFGDGGMVTCNNKDYYEKLKILRVHGSEPKYYHKVVGGNFRLDALQAAVVAAKLPYLETWTGKRRKNAETYNRLFEQSGLAEQVRCPREIFARHIYNQYVIRLRTQKQRDRLRDHLKEKNIATEIYYPVPLHLQECFKDLGHRPGDFPNSEKAAAETLALPVSHEVTAEQQEYVVDCIRRFVS